MIDGPILVMTAWLAGVATGISAARLSSWIHHIRQRPTCRGLMSGGSLGTQPLIFNEGRTMRGNGTGGPSTPKPNIIPKPQFPPPQKIREDFLP